MIKGNSQFDGHVARAFLDGSMGAGISHEKILSAITQPILFLHANWRVSGDRLLGALDDNDVARAKSLVKGHFRYEAMHCAHAIPMVAPEREAEMILDWLEKEGL